MQAERDAEDCYKAEYMRGHLGERFMGRVSGVTAKGLFVMLENTVEGYLPAAARMPAASTSRAALSKASLRTMSALARAGST